jgi:hypothetical protein
MYSNLKFFDHKGHLLNFQYNSILDKWTGNLYIDSISEGLVENLTFYLLETIYENDSMFPTIKFPTNNVGDDEWYLEFDSNLKSIPELFLYTFGKDVDGSSYLIKETTHDLVLDKATVTYINNRKVVYNQINGTLVHLRTSPMQINVGFEPTSENKFENTLYIKTKNTNVIIAEINVYGEGIEEDERLRDLLVNLGHDLLPEDYKIFYNSDVKEESIDWQLINTKRKELLLEHSNIFPYVGSYKALINILKFYGYNNVKMKEYWQNVKVGAPDYGKYKQVDITDLFIVDSKMETSNLINSKVYKKTNLMSLYYDITIEDGTYDEDGLPYTKETFTFTQEEVLIKLFALKKKLQQYFLPLNSKIVDIIGESIYFGLYKVLHLTSENSIRDINIGIKTDFNLFPFNEFYIDDLRYLGFTGNIELDQTQINKVLTGIKSSNYDVENIPVGCPIILTNTTFNLHFDDLQITYNQLVELSNHPSIGSTSNRSGTWDNVSKLGNIELVWEITKQTTNNDDRTFSFIKNVSLIESIENTSQIGVILPFDGFYNIRLSIIDAFNQHNTVYKPSVIEVKTKEAEFIGWYKFMDKVYTWDTSNICPRQSDRSTEFDKELFGPLMSWDNYTSIWERPVHPNESIEMADLSYHTLDSINEFETAQLENQQDLNYFDYSFNAIGLNASWDDIYHLQWNDGGPRRTEWRLRNLVDVNYSGFYEIQIKTNVSSSYFTHSGTLTDKVKWIDLYNLLCAQGGVFKNFVYFLQDDQHGTIDIVAVSKEYDCSSRYTINVFYNGNNITPAYTGEPYNTNYLGFIGNTPGYFELYDIVPRGPVTITIKEQANNINDNHSIGYSSNNSSSTIREYNGSGYNNLLDLYFDLISTSNDLSRYVFDNFSINPVYLDDTKTNLLKIQFIEKQYNYTTNYSISYVNATGSDFLHSIIKNTSYNDLRILKYQQELPLLTQVNFCYDNSKIPGKVNPIWVIEKLDDSSFTDIYNRNRLFSYTFSERGSYTISLYLEDTNGNKSTKIKNEIIKII